MDNRHGTVIVFFDALIRESCIAHGHLDILMTKDLLQDLDTHAMVDHLRGEGMSEAVETVAFI